MNKQTTRRPRRRKFYFEIHLSNKYVVSGTELYSGMLEAEREISRRAVEVSKQVELPYRGAVIIDLRRAGKCL